MKYVWLIIVLCAVAIWSYWIISSVFYGALPGRFFVVWALFTALFVSLNELFKGLSAL